MKIKIKIGNEIYNKENNQKIKQSLIKFEKPNI